MPDCTPLINPKIHIGNLLSKKIRLSRTLKQSALAAAVCISVIACNDIEREKTIHITLLRLEQTRAVLDVPVSVIISAATGNNIDRSSKSTIGK